MPDLEDHQSKTTTKMLLIGDPGSGKTGALASLANAGYKLWWIDFDNGLDIILDLFKSTKSPYKREAMRNIKYKTLTAPMKNSGGKLIPVSAKVWPDTLKLLEGGIKWDLKNPAEEPGGVVNLGLNDVLVLDSLTFLSKAALAYTMSLNNRLGQRAQLQDWGDGQALIEGLLGMLYDESIKCNTIIISHITYIGEDGGLQIGYPNTLGKALPPKVGSYFNSVIQMKTSGTGAGRKRKLITHASGQVELKNAAPLTVKPEYDIVFGLAELFADLKGGATPSLPTGQGPKLVA